MGIGVSVFLIALGAVLAFAVDVQTTGIDLNTVGVILMVVGGIGLAATLMLFGDSGWMSGRRYVESDVVDEPMPVSTRPVTTRVVHEEEVPVESRRRVVRRRIEY